MRYFSVITDCKKYWVQNANSSIYKLTFDTSYKKLFTFWAFKNEHDAKTAFDKYMSAINNNTGQKIPILILKNEIYNEEDFKIFLAETKLRL
jgi:hypothetical protein